MFTIDRSLAAEIDYRTQRVRQEWAPRRRGIRLPAVRRRLRAGVRPGGIGTLIAAR